MRARPRSRLIWTVAATLAVLVMSSYAYAQFRRGGFGGRFDGLRGEQGDPAELPQKDKPDGNLTACHMLYTSTRREPSGAGWRTDYPWGERHLLMRSAELTKMHISRAPTSVPHSWLVRLTDPALFECPFVMASDVGTIGLQPDEAQQAQLYEVAAGKHLRVHEGDRVRVSVLEGRRQVMDLPVSVLVDDALGRVGPGPGVDALDLVPLRFQGNCHLPGDAPRHSRNEDLHWPPPPTNGIRPLLPFSIN